MFHNYITVPGAKSIKEYSVDFTAHWDTDAHRSQINMVGNDPVAWNREKMHLKRGLFRSWGIKACRS